MQAGNVIAGRVIQPQPPRLAQLHDGGSRNGLRMRRDPKPVLGSQRFVGRDVGDAVGSLQHNAPPLGHGKRQPRQPRMSHLQFEPATHVTQAQAAARSA
jgi:hypothetical protein